MTSSKPEVATEPLARIKPHARWREAGRFGQGRKRFEVVLVGIFGVYRFARFKLDLQHGFRFGGANIDLLLGEADQVDFYAALLFVEKGAVFEQLEVEIGVQFAVDAEQRVPAEGSRQAERVVVGGFERFARFFQIGAEQQTVTLPQRAANLSKQFARFVRSVVAYVRSQQQRKDPLAVPTGDRSDSASVIGGVSHDPQPGIILEQLLGALLQNRLGNVYRLVTKFCLARQNGFDQQPRLDRASAAQFDYRDRRRQLRDDLSGAPLENLGLGARQIIFGQKTDRLEEQRPQRVIKIFRFEGFRRRGQSGAHVLGEAVLIIRRN